MEGTENTQTQENEIVSTQAAEGTANTNDANAEAQTLPAAELSFEDQVKQYYSAKGRNIESLDDLLVPVEKEVEKIVNPYEGVIDDEDRQYLDFKKETGRGRKEFEALNRDWNAVSAIELAREKVRRDHDLPNLSDDQINEFLEEELNISLDDLTTNGEIKLAGFVKDLRLQKKSEQEQYRKPLENKPQAQQNAANEERIKLPNGAEFSKAEYDVLVEKQQQSIKVAVEAVKTTQPAKLKLVVDDNGVDRELNYSYEYTEQDVQSMASIVSDLEGTIQKRYSTEKGDFNYQKLGEGQLWADEKFREKALSNLATRIRAEAIEEVMKNRGNHNFDRHEGLPKQTREGVTMVSIADIAKQI